MTGLFRIATLSLFALGAAGAATDAVQAQGVHHGASWGAHADLFSSTNFRGHRIRLTTSVADLRWYGFGGRVGSVRVVGRWRLCSMTNFRGHCTTVTHNRSSLGGLRVESVRFVSR
jgi:hypothetical protein